jgi:hypothetical protein
MSEDLCSTCCAPLSGPPVAADCPIPEQHGRRGRLRRYKVWHGVLMTPRGVEARHADGRSARQVRAAVRATSQKAAAEAFRVSVGYLRDYFGCDPAEEYRIPLLEEAEAGTVAVCPMDPGDTIDGQRGWIVVPPRA